MSLGGHLLFPLLWATAPRHLQSRKKGTELGRAREPSALPAPQGPHVLPPPPAASAEALHRPHLVTGLATGPLHAASASRIQSRPWTQGQPRTLGSHGSTGCLGQSQRCQTAALPCVRTWPSLRTACTRLHRVELTRQQACRTSGHRTLGVPTQRSPRRRLLLGCPQGQMALAGSSPLGPPL